MSVSTQDIKDFFALVGKTVTDQHLLKVQEALATQRYGFEENGVTPRVPDTTDFVDWLYRHAKDFVNRHTENNARANVEIPKEDLLDE